MLCKKKYDSAASLESTDQLQRCLVMQYLVWYFSNAQKEFLSILTEMLLANVNGMGGGWGGKEEKWNWNLGLTDARGLFSSQMSVLFALQHLQLTHLLMFVCSKNLVCISHLFCTRVKSERGCTRERQRPWNGHFIILLTEYWGIILGKTNR